MVVVKHCLRYQILLSIQAESNISVKHLLTAHCDPAQDTQQTQGQLVQWSRSVARKVELIDEGTKIYAKPRQSWSYMMKSNQPGTSVYSARPLGS